MYMQLYLFFFFFFNDTATTEIYTLSLHDALPISSSPVTPPAQSASLTSLQWQTCLPPEAETLLAPPASWRQHPGDRKSTRLNSSHLVISYAVFCLKKKNYHTAMQSTLTNYRRSAI